uniref:MAT1-1-1 n=1 Tax=Hypocrella siamensis TaxID=696354 RepID=A0A0N7HV79_9HYPO|nr:MAT1-1-1 [Hypocrella siamensis]
MFVKEQRKPRFITTLWNKDPFRSRWGLIASVYSFVRDELGKGNVPLVHFLNFACPVMGILPPRAYLNVLGWTLHRDGDSQTLVQNQAVASAAGSRLQAEKYPGTETELLSAVIDIGYLPDQGADLMNKLRVDSHGTTTAFDPRMTLSVSYTPEKLHFMNTIRTDPLQATKELLGHAYDDYAIEMHGVKSHCVENLDSISHLPMQVALPDPRYYYNYSSSHSQLVTNSAPVMSFEDIPDHETFDIDSPWDVDTILGQDKSEGQRSRFLVRCSKQN